MKDTVEIKDEKEKPELGEELLTKSTRTRLIAMT
jgi:hypothetical protein